MIRRRHDRKRCAFAARRHAIAGVAAQFKPRVEVEKELELMPAAARERVFDDPVTLAFLESYEPPVRDRFDEPCIRVMLGIQHVARGRAVPPVHARANVRS